MKGSLCSVSEKTYELQVYNIVKKCKLNNNNFNTQNENELGGCKMSKGVIPIEIKKNENS